MFYSLRCVFDDLCFIKLEQNPSFVLLIDAWTTHHILVLCYGFSLRCLDSQKEVKVSKLCFSLSHLNTLKISGIVDNRLRRLPPLLQKSGSASGDS